MTNFTAKFTALVCTVLMSTALVTAAVGPAQAGVGTDAANAVVSTTRVA